MSDDEEDFEWYEGFDETYNRCYYFNTRTKESCWEKPAKYKPYNPDDDDDDDDDASDDASSSDGGSSASASTASSASPTSQSRRSSAANLLPSSSLTLAGGPLSPTLSISSDYLSSPSPVRGSSSSSAPAAAGPAASLTIAAFATASAVLSPSLDQNASILDAGGSSSSDDDDDEGASRDARGPAAPAASISSQPHSSDDEQLAPRRLPAAASSTSPSPISPQLPAVLSPQQSRSDDSNSCDSDSESSDAERRKEAAWERGMAAARRFGSSSAASTALRGGGMRDVVDLLDRQEQALREVMERRSAIVEADYDGDEPATTNNNGKGGNLPKQPLTHAGAAKAHKKNKLAHKPTKAWGAGIAKNPLDTLPPPPSPSSRLFQPRVLSAGGDFVGRQELDMANRARDHNRTIEAEAKRSAEALKAATALKPTTKRILKESGMSKLSKQEWVDRMHLSRVNHMAAFIMGQKGVTALPSKYFNERVTTAGIIAGVAPTNRDRINSSAATTAGGLAAIAAASPGHTLDHRPTFFTSPTSRHERARAEHLPTENDVRLRTASADIFLNKSRFDFNRTDLERVEKGWEADELLSPRKRVAGASTSFFGTAAADRDEPEDPYERLNVDPNDDEAVMFLDLFKKRMRDPAGIGDDPAAAPASISSMAATATAQITDAITTHNAATAETAGRGVSPPKTGGRRMTIGVEMLNGGRGVGKCQTRNFDSLEAESRFIEKFASPQPQSSSASDGGKTSPTHHSAAASVGTSHLTLTPKSGRSGRRLTTSHLLVTSICKHVAREYAEIAGDGNVAFLDYAGFGLLLERMAFLGGEHSNTSLRGSGESDARLLDKLWNMYATSTQPKSPSCGVEKIGPQWGVTLESTQRLLIQVLAGLDISQSMSRHKLEKSTAEGGDSGDADGAAAELASLEGERQLTSALSILYNERRLCSKPRHHQNREEKHGLLYQKTTKEIVGASGAVVSSNAPVVGLSAATVARLEKRVGSPTAAASAAAALSNPISSASSSSVFPASSYSTLQPAQSKSQQQQIVSPFVSAAKVSVGIVARRRASTMTTRLRIRKSSGNKKALEEHYSCTFKPKISERSRKLDARNYAHLKSNNNPRGSSRSRSRSPGRSKKASAFGDDGDYCDEDDEEDEDEYQTERACYLYSVKFLQSIYKSGGGNTVVSLRDIKHAFDDLLNDKEHELDAKEAVMMIVRSFRDVAGCSSGNGEERDSTTPADKDQKVTIKSLMMRFRMMYGGGLGGSNTNAANFDEGRDDPRYVPPNLAARLERWERWQKRRELRCSAEREKQVAELLKDCTFKPTLNKYTERLAQGGASSKLNIAVGVRLYADAERWRQDQFEKRRNKGKELRRREEIELEECTFKPKVSSPVNDTASFSDVTEIKGVNEFLKKTEKAKMKQQHEKMRRDKMQLRKTGEHLFSKWDPSPKVCEPFAFNNLGARDFEGREERRLSALRLAREAEILEERKKAALLKQGADKVGSQARRQDFLARQLNRHVGPPMLVLEVTTATGATERLHIWEDDDLDELGTAYAKSNNLTEAGRVELIKVLKGNVENIRNNGGGSGDEDDYDEEDDRRNRLGDRSLGRNQDETEDEDDDEGETYEDDYEEEEIDDEIVIEENDEDGKLRIDELL